MTSELGWVEVERTAADPLLDALPRRFECFASHRDEVAPGARELRPLARSERCAVQAFRVLDAPAWGVQFHPEMEREETDALVRSAVHDHPHLAGDAEAVLARASDGGPLGRALLDRFAALARGRREDAWTS